MKNYETYEKAQRDFAAFAGYYVILKYGYASWSEYYGSKKHGRWYRRTGYSIVEGAKHIQYELFQVGKRGGLKRLHLVAKNLPEGTPFISSMQPDEATCCRYEDGEYRIIEEVLDALIESIPETEWKDGPGPVTDYCY